MENDRNPNRHIGNWYVDVRKILCRPARIAQLDDAVPDEEARHQQARKRRQVGFHGVLGLGSPEQSLCLFRVFLASFWYQSHSPTHAKYSPPPSVRQAMPSKPIP